MDYETPSAFAKRIIDEAVANAFKNGVKAGKKNVGTKTVIMSFLYKDGIMIAADRQVTGGYKIVRKNFPKIFRASAFSAVSFCGTVSMAQIVAKIFKNVLASTKFRIEEEVPVRGQIRELEELMQTLGLYMGEIGVELHFAGLDIKTGRPHLLEIFEDGCVLRPDSPFIADGSGGIEAKTKLTDYFKTRNPREMEFDEAMRLALQTIQMCAESDAGVGDPRLQGATLATITMKDGFSFVDEATVNKFIAEVCK